MMIRLYPRFRSRSFVTNTCSIAFLMCLMGPAQAYDRTNWKHWTDDDGDCINTRHEMLMQQADGRVKMSPNGCFVSVGRWIDPFSGKTFNRASDLDVDHIVPLYWAFKHGGEHWSKRKKKRFANDPVNLLVVWDVLNKKKGAKGPSEWLPPNHVFRCEYLEVWDTILRKYSSLQMTPGESRIFARQLSACRR